MPKTKEERIETMEKELAALKADLASKPKPWPQDDDDIFCLGSDGDIDDTYYDSGCDEGTLDQGNVFRTEAEATKERDKRALLWEMAQDNSFVPDWKDNNQQKWFHSYSHRAGRWYPRPVCWNQQSLTPYYRGRDDCEAAIKKYGRRMTECLL